MSLFIDVIEPLSSIIKEKFNGIIEAERQDQQRPVRRICDTCSKYLVYGELRYDKMEDGIRYLNQDAHISSSLFNLLMTVMHESLDEDQKALDFLGQFAETSAAREFMTEISDFITIAKFSALKQFNLLETAGTIIIERYSDEESITDTVSNIYLKVDNEEYLPTIQKLLASAKIKYPELLALDSLTGFIQIMAKDYNAALATFTSIKDNLLQNTDDHPNSNDSLAAVWDNIAICHLNLGDGNKALESCDQAIKYDNNAMTYRIGLSVLYKKAEAYLLLSQNDQADDMANQILAQFPEDEKALEIKSRIRVETR